MGTNYPPKVTYPSQVIFSRSNKAGATDVTTALDAQVLSMEQRTGAGNDTAVIRFPRKRLEYFEHADSGYIVSQLDNAAIYMGGKLQMYGRIRNWNRSWNGSEEEVDVLVIGNDRLMDDICRGRVYGRYKFADNTVEYEKSIPSDELIFNRNGMPDFNKARTTQDATGMFWGSQNKWDSTVGYWNPIWQMKYLQARVFGPASSDYVRFVSAFGAVASVGGWSSYESNGDINYQKQFPELNVDGLTYAEAFDRVLDQAGGYKVAYFVTSTTPSWVFLPFRTFPPYTPVQQNRTVYLSSATSSQEPTVNNVQRGRISRDDSRRVTHVIGHGSFERYVGTYKLRPGWNPSLTNAVLSNPDLINREPDNADYNALYADVMRRWVLQTSATDLNTVCGTTNKFSGERHRFAPAIEISYNPDASIDEKRAGLQPLLMFTTDFATSATLKRCDVTARILEDTAGIYIEGTGPKLEDSIFRRSVTSGLIRATVFDIFFTGALVSDARLVSSQIDSKVANGTMPDISYVVNYGNSFQKEVRAPSMGSYSTGGNRRIAIEHPNYGIVYTTLSQFGSVNDQAGLDQAVLDTYRFYNTLYDHGILMIPWIESTYAIGDIIGSIYDRNIVLNSVVVRRKWDFEAQTTELELSDERYRAGVEPRAPWDKPSPAAGYAPGTKSIAPDFWMV